MIAGDEAPNFSLYDHRGESRTLSELLAGGPVVLFFFPLASSPICTAEACHFRDLSDQFATVGAQRVGISADTVARQARFAEQRAFDYPLLSDTGGAVSGQFGVSRGTMAKLGRVFIRRQLARHGRHSRHGLLTRVLMAAKRTTFVIDTDRTVLKVISSELRASMHADQALSLLKQRDLPPESPAGSPDTKTPAIRQTAHDHSG